MSNINRRDILEWLWAGKTDTNPLGALLRAPLSALGFVYSALMRARAHAYATGLIRSEGLPVKVIAVGNLTLGGTGKTPLVAKVAHRLASSDRKVAVVLRGYKRKSGDPVLVVSRGQGPLCSAELAGDEAVWLAEKLKGIPVIVSADRVQAGRQAIEELGVTHLVLDDALQHLKIKRDLNILVVDGRKNLEDEHVFPRGRLREPLGAAERADMIVAGKLESEPDLDAAWLKRLNPEVPMYPMRYIGRCITGLDGRKQQGKDKQVVAFCGLAEPEYFFKTLEDYGLTISDRIVFPDHHSYSGDDLKILEERCKRAGTSRLVTTEKDAVKLGGLNSDLDIGVFKVELDWFGQEDRFFDQIDSILEGT